MNRFFSRSNSLALTVHSTVIDSSLYETETEGRDVQLELFSRFSMNWDSVDVKGVMTGSLETRENTTDALDP